MKYEHKTYGIPFRPTEEVEALLKMLQDNYNTRMDNLILQMFYDGFIQPRQWGNPEIFHV